MNSSFVRFFFSFSLWKLNLDRVSKGCMSPFVENFRTTNFNIIKCVCFDVPLGLRGSSQGEVFVLVRLLGEFMFDNCLRIYAR